MMRMYSTPKLERRVRGGATAIGGMLLVGVGALGAFFGVTALSNQLWLQVSLNGVPMSSVVLNLVYLLLAVCATSGALGAFTVVWARPERDRAEEARLDPLRYPPFRRPWRWGVPIAVAVGVLLAVLMGFSAPVAHPLAATLPVGQCSGSPPPSGSAGTTSWDIPNGATFTLHWYSSTGQVVSMVSLPGAPYVLGLTSPSSVTSNSSQGWVGGDASGASVELWACDDPGLLADAPSLTVTVSGTYYTTLVG
jgi:hypothetical protein